MNVDCSAATASADREWNLFLATASVDPGESRLVRIRTLLEEQVDWEIVLRLADDHGTSSLLYHNCLKLNGPSLPAALMALREEYDWNVQKSLFLARELIRVLDCLEGLGVEAIPYKGVALSEAYYGDMAARPSGDLDLFVRKKDVERIRKAVLDLGYTPRMRIPDAAWRSYIASGYECTFDSSAGKNLLEFQWALQPRFYAVDFDMDGLFDRAVNATVAGRRMKTPSPEDLLLVLSVHAAKHVWQRLIWLCDIAQIVKREDLDWDWIQAQAGEFGIGRILRVTLLLMNRFFAEAIPSGMGRALIEDRAAHMLADEIAVAISRGIPYEEVPYFRLMMRLRERRTDRMRFLTRLTFTPGPGEWEVVRLPKTLFPLYRAVRLARLAARFTRG